MKRGFVDTPEGQIHYVAEGSGEPVLLLHQTPRSSDEYRDVLPILGKKFMAIAMDTIGYGDSYKPKRTCLIEDYANGALQLVRGLGLEKLSIVGHHTGGVIAIEFAVKHPEMVKKLVLSAAPYVDEAARKSHLTRPPVDAYEFKEDGSHLVELWRRRTSRYPKGRPDLLTRYVIDALKAGEKVEEGHHAVYKYHMQEKLHLITCPTLVICGSLDDAAYPSLERVAQSISGSRMMAIEGGMIPVDEQMPDVFAKVVMDFLGE